MRRNYTSPKTEKEEYFLDDALLVYSEGANGSTEEIEIIPDYNW